jgi:hypothetical protein
MFAENFMSSKLKMPINQIIAICAVIFLVTLIAEDQLNGTMHVLWFWGSAIIIWNIINAKKTDLPSFIVIGVIGGTAAWHYLIISKYDTPLSTGTWLIHMVILVAVGIYYLNTNLSRHTDLEKNAFKLFRLASASVWETTNGYTSRPYPAGSISSRKEDILKFASFMYDKNIARPVASDDQVYFMFSMNTSPVSNPPAGPPLDKVSYASFDFSGGLSVKISKDDYRQYREEYNFEQLCSSLSDIFKDFFELHKEGKEYAIIDKMNHVKLNPFN